MPLWSGHVWTCFLACPLEIANSMKSSLFGQVGLNLVPQLHRSVSLQHRCELGVSGFVGLDIMRMLAEETCTRFNVPTGSTFYAGQTLSNLQATCLSGILVTLTKPTDFDPWTRGHCRLSELPIEEHFSLLRRQSGNAQLSCRGFWQAAARVSLKTGVDLNREKPFTLQGQPALSPEECLSRLLNTFDIC